MEYRSAGLLHYPVGSVDFKQLLSASIAFHRPQGEFSGGRFDGKFGVA
jgi:hypothetical protein